MVPEGWIAEQKELATLIYEVPNGYRISTHFEDDNFKGLSLEQTDVIEIDDFNMK